MRTVVVLGLAVTILLGGCASTGFLGFLATTPYVRQRVDGAAREEARQREQLEQEIDTLRRNVADIQRLTGELETLMRRIDRTERNTEELKSLTTLMQTRLEALPRDTLEELVVILQGYLKKTARLQ